MKYKYKRSNFRVAYDYLMNQVTAKDIQKEKLDNSIRDY